MECGEIADLDKPVSRIVQGLTMASTERLDETFEVLDAAYEAGINTFDGAHVYQGGASDSAFGRWVRSRGLREEIVLLQKGCHPYAGRPRVTPTDLAADLDECLQRLGFDYIDVFSPHRDDPAKPVGPIVEALNEHLQAGRIRAFGTSNWTHQRIQRANEYATARGLRGFAISSVHYSLAECYEPPWDGCLTITGQDGQAARHWYQQSQLPLFSWSSLSGGLFSGRFRRDNLRTFTDYDDTLCIRCYCREANFRRLDRAEELVKAKGATAAQIALAYALCSPMNIFPLMAAHTPHQARENAAAVDIKLTEQEIAWLDLRGERR